MARSAYFSKLTNPQITGTSSCVLALRLSEDAEVTVLLIEVGGKY